MGRFWKADEEQQKDNNEGWILQEEITDQVRDVVVKAGITSSNNPKNKTRLCEWCL